MSEATEPALVLVATPIGNLGDISVRAIDELRRASVIACEDTRRTGMLLKHLGVEHSPFVVCNDHTEARVAGELVARIEAGERVVLVSDAGMPAISDPGQRVVEAAVEAGLTVSSVPGPSAALTALVTSGLPTDRFCFEGFLPRSGAQRADRLTQIAREGRTTVLYESPRRVARTLADLASAAGPGRRVAVARELTKLYEDVWRGTLAEAVEAHVGTEPRGEMVIVLEGAAPAVMTDERIVAALRREIAEGATRRGAVDAVVDGLGVAKRRVYDLALDL